MGAELALGSCELAAGRAPLGAVPSAWYNMNSGAATDTRDDV